MQKLTLKNMKFSTFLKKYDLKMFWFFFFVSFSIITHKLSISFYILNTIIKLILLVNYFLPHSIR